MTHRGFAALVFMWAIAANAAETETISFDGAVIDGKVAGPTGAQVNARAPDSFEPLIHERADFRERFRDELPDVEIAEPLATPAPAVRVAQAGTVDPCHDEIYLQLRAKDMETLSDREFEVFKAKDQACNEARVRAVATPIPAATPSSVVVPDGGGFQANPQSTPEATPPAKKFGQPWGAKELLMLMFGGVALLLLMMGGMLLLITVLAG